MPPLTFAHMVLCAVCSMVFIHLNRFKGFARPRISQICIKAGAQFKIMIGIAFCCINERSHGVFIGIFLFQNRKLFNFSPTAVRHLSQQVLHGIRIGTGKLRRVISEGIGRTANKLIDAVLLPDIIKPQSVCFSYVIHVDNSGAVALNSDIFIGALINIVAEMIGIACCGVSMGIPAKRRGCRQTVRTRNNIAALCVFLYTADKLYSSSSAFCSQYTAVYVVSTVLQRALYVRFVSGTVAGRVSLMPSPTPFVTSSQPSNT